MNLAVLSPLPHYTHPRVDEQSLIKDVRWIPWSISFRRVCFVPKPLPNNHLPGLEVTNLQSQIRWNPYRNVFTIIDTIRGGQQQPVFSLQRCRLPDRDRDEVTHEHDPTELALPPKYVARGCPGCALQVQASTLPSSTSLSSQHTPNRP